MRVGYNPNKDKPITASKYIHQVVIPVYIPHQEEYFKDSFKIFKLCITSLLQTVHDRTFITIVNNGSCTEVRAYLDEIFKAGSINELIHTDNIGKINSILKGIVGNSIELVTISDSDVLFLSNWQYETANIFKFVPQAGVVGIVPQFKMYKYNCGNVIYDNLFNKKLSFLPVKNPEALKRFYKSIGWDKSYNQNYLKYNLGLVINSDLNVLVGSGHFVATYKKDVFEEVQSFVDFKLGGISELYLDKAPLKKGYWRLTTEDNFAYHMGNTYEDWMQAAIVQKKKIKQYSMSKFKINKKITRYSYFLKNRVFVKLISIPLLSNLFLKWKKLPQDIIKGY